MKAISRSVYNVVQTEVGQTWLRKEGAGEPKPEGGAVAGTYRDESGN